MTNSEKYLKSTYQWKLWTFMTAHMALFWLVLFSGELPLSEYHAIWATLTVKKGLFATLGPLITVVVTGLLPSNIKAILVFWRIKCPLPGCWAFTRLIRKDPRIDPETLIKKHGTLPTDPIKQNRLWYHIYESHRCEITVVESHKAFLLTRDLAAVSMLLLLCPLLALVWHQTSVAMVVGYGVVLTAQYAVVSLVARNYGKRFVCNVLAQESVKP